MQWPPPPPHHFRSPLIYLVIIKISFTHNHKMITLHNTTLGNGSLVKCTSNCGPLHRILDKKFTSPLETIGNSHGAPFFSHPPPSTQITTGPSCTFKFGLIIIAVWGTLFCIVLLMWHCKNIYDFKINSIYYFSKK